MSHLQYMPGDHRLVDQLVYELKSKGIFDQFRKDCIADVDTRPAYQNLRQRVESSVSVFLSRQKWKPDLNKNQLREKLRKHILDGNYLEQGVERIVDQVVNPKVASCFVPQVEDLVYNYLGIPRKKAEPAPETSNGVKSDDLLPTDLEAVSPGSVDDKEDKEVTMDIATDDIPIPEAKVEDKKDEDSQMSGVIDLTSRDSEMSIDKSQIPLPAEGIKLENIPRPENSPPEMEVQEIELPKAPYPSTEIPLPDEIPPLNQDYFKLESSDDDDSSSDSSLIRNRMSPLTPVRTFDDENSCDAQQAFEDGTNDKPTLSTFKFSIESSQEDKKDDLSYQFENQVSFNTPAYEDSSSSNNLQIDESDANSKAAPEKETAENNNTKDPVVKKPYKIPKLSRHSSSKKPDSKSSRDRHDSKSEKKSDDSKKSSKEERKDRDSRDSSKHRSSSHKSSSKDKSKSSSSSSSSKHTKADDKKSKSSSSRDKSKDSKSSKDKDRRSSSKKDEKKKEKKDTDDHYGLSGRGNSTRRSTDRDSNDGNSSSSKSSNVNSSSKTEAKNGKSSKSENTSSCSTGTSPSEKEVIINEAKHKAIRVDSQLKTPIRDSKIKFTPEVVLKKPKFAANFEEAKKMMKMRRFLNEEQKRMNQEAALLLEFHANVRPSMSQAYSSISGPELEFACHSNEKDIETNEMIEDFVKNTTNESITDISFEEDPDITEENIVEDLSEQNFEVTIIEEDISENEDQKSIYNQDLAMKIEGASKTEDLSEDFQYFTGEELFDSLQKQANYTDFYKKYTNKVKSRLFLVNCTKYEEDIIRDVSKQETVSYTRNGHFKPVEVKVFKDIIDKEVNLPEESIPPIFSPIKSECSFELSSEYDLRIEDMVKTTSRQQIMEIILGSAIDESPSKMPRIDFCNESSLESDSESCKRKFSEVESVDNNNREVLMPNKIRKICETEQISSTTEEDEDITSNHITIDANVQRSKYLGKARRVGLPKPKKKSLSNSPSSDKSVENYEQPTINGKVKTTLRNNIQRYDTTDLYKPKLHFLSRRNNVS